MTSTDATTLFSSLGVSDIVGGAAAVVVPIAAVAVAFRGGLKLAGKVVKTIMRQV
jgi:hypothetical protein